MKYSNLALSIVLILSSSISTFALSLEDAVLSGNKPKSLSESVSSNDGETYYCMTDSSKIEKIDYKTGKVLGTIFDPSTARNCNHKDWDGFILSPDETKILLYTNKKMIYRHSFEADYYVFELKRNNLKPLSADGRQEIATFSPDGRMVAYVRDNNIYLKKLDFDSEVPVTTNGSKGKIINGVPDWVYQEEFGILNSLTFSADSQILCFLQWNEEDVNNYNFQLYEGACNPQVQYANYPGTFSYKYPVAGTPNAKVKVVSYDIDNRKLKVISFPSGADYYIPQISFAPNSSRLMVMTLNRNQNKLQLFEANPRATTSKLIYTDESSSWINIEKITGMTHFYENTFIIPSEKSGYCHLYEYHNSGSLLKQITNGEWSVTNFYGFDPLTKSYYFQSTQDGPLNRCISKIDTKGSISKVSTETGWNEALFNSNLSYYILNYSNVTTPNQYKLYNKGKKLRNLELNNEYKEKFNELPQKEFFTFTSDGNTFNGYIIKPSNFNASHKYPLIMCQYSGPGSQEVKNSWNLNWEQYAAENGYIIACVDGRGTGGRGKKWESTVYMQLGKFESIDQVAAAKYMAQQPYVDRNNIGIFGWSFGGYETLMAMSQSNSIYKAGVAVAPVTDWKFYDTIYTERFMRTPAENEEGYRTSSAINAIPELKGDILLISGTADDNVHIQNTYQYVANLTMQNKLCDMMIYPNMNHSINYCNARLPLFMRITEYFNQKLKH